MDNLLVSISSLQGKRPSNQDAHSVFLNKNNTDPTYSPINYYAVYDGHGDNGEKVSEFLKNNLVNYFSHKEVILPLTKEYINKVFDDVQNLLKNEEYSRENGSTCCAVVQYKSNDNEYLHVINSGDSRAAMCLSNYIAMNMTLDHKPDFPLELVRIKKLGGKISKDKYDCWRIEGGLAISRSFGDVSSYPYLSHVPDIYKYHLTDQPFIIIACDGVWDVLDSQAAVNFVLNMCYHNKELIKEKCTNIANDLAEYCIKCGSTDNVSVIIVFF